MKNCLAVCALILPTIVQFAFGQHANSLILKADSAYEQNQFAESARLYERAVNAGAKSTVVLYNASCSFARAGNKDKALKYLELAVDKGWRNVDRMQQDSDFVNLRSHPRWMAALKKAQLVRDAHDHLDALVGHLRFLAAQANQYRTTPRSVEGGEGSFVGYIIPPKLVTTPAGTFIANVSSPSSIEFTATSSLGRGTVTARLDASGRLGHPKFTGELKKLAEK